ncbi:MAG: hypothetical protein GY817_01155 [bacterium]|nr:hypothetical protein [bacterium]
MYEGSLFHRICTVEIGEAGKEGNNFGGLRTKFNIKKNIQSTANQGTIELYNLNATSRGFLDGFAEKKDTKKTAKSTKFEKLVCILKAGYKGITVDEENLDIIFSGDIYRVSHEKKGVDIITTLECGDSQRKLTETHIEQSFKAGTKNKKIIEYVVEKLGLTIGRQVKLSDIEYSKGLTITGNITEIMDTLTEREDVNWHVQDGVVYIDDDTFTAEQEKKAIVIAKNTGLIGLPILREKGLEVISLLQPSIKPGKFIKLESSIKEGFFKVREAVYEGDTLDGNWQVRLIVE